MFHLFKNQEERRAFGGSAFVEIQYCKLPAKTPIRKLVAVNSINSWEDSSLYVFLDDTDDFYWNYKDILYGGVYNNLKTGYFDICGINYYSPDQLKEFITKIEQLKPLDYTTLLEWLQQGVNYNGFYILGL